MSGIVGQNLGRGSGLVKATAVVADSVTGASIADDAVDSEHIADNAIGLVALASGTDGNLISYDTSGNPVAVATGNDGQVLTSSGAGAVCAFEDATGGGKIGQVVFGSSTSSSTSTTMNQWISSGLTATITPTATSSKIWVIAGCPSLGNSQTGYNIKLALQQPPTGNADVHGIGAGSGTSYTDYNAQGPEQTNHTYRAYTWSVLHSPSSTSALVYGIAYRGEAGGSGTLRFNVPFGGGSPCFAHITLMEVLA